jgi:hypothetical protein
MLYGIAMAVVLYLGAGLSVQHAIEAAEPIGIVLGVIFGLFGTICGVIAFLPFYHKTTPTGGCRKTPPFLLP